MNRDPLRKCAGCVTFAADSSCEFTADRKVLAHRTGVAGSDDGDSKLAPPVASTARDAGWLLAYSSWVRKGSLNLCAISGQNSRRTSQAMSLPTLKPTRAAVRPKPRGLPG